MSVITDKKCGVWILDDIHKKIGCGFYDYDTSGDPGQLWTWGHNAHGQLGDNTTTNKSSPIQIAGTTWVDIAGSSHHSLARKSI